ncbi:MAG: hypothetical protein WCJ63_05820 [Actinomycetes bacterium]
MGSNIVWPSLPLVPAGPAPYCGRYVVLPTRLDPLAVHQSGFAITPLLRHDATLGTFTPSALRTAVLSGHSPKRGHPLVATRATAGWPVAFRTHIHGSDPVNTDRIGTPIHFLWSHSWRHGNRV